MEPFKDFMHYALAEATSAYNADEVPVGAVIVSASGQILSQAQNRMRRNQDATAHAELLAIRQAMQNRGNSRLESCDIWVTLEPCAMCAAAISHARIRRLYFGAYDTKSGAVENGPCLYSHHTIHHRPEVIGGISEAPASQLLQDFFAAKR